MPCTVTRVHVNVTLDFVDFAFKQLYYLASWKQITAGWSPTVKTACEPDTYVCGECYLRQSSCHVLQAHLAGRF